MTCDHAGNRIPRALGDLGLSETELQRHIVWDIGAAAVARTIADQLDANLILQRYSRLVIDCNRAPEMPSSIATLSELTRIPGNENIGAEHRAARRAEIFDPYHAAISAALDRRSEAGFRTIFLAIHSFTPVYIGIARAWHTGVLYNKDPSFARIMRDLLIDEGDLVVGDNEPYSLSDDSDYTVPVHAERRGLPYLELEIRQDLIAEEAGQKAWADRLIRLLPTALSRLRLQPVS